jgi:hypothetical protein
MYDPDRDFLATSRRLPIVRQLDIKHRIRQLQTPLPVRLLVIVAEDVDPLNPLDSFKELSHLDRALNELKGLIEPVILRGRVTYDGLEEAM